MPKLWYAGKCDAGFQRSVNEDFLYVKELAPDVVVAIVADGAGSTGTTFQPASIVSLEIFAVLERLYESHPDLLLENAEIFLSEALQSANRILASFQTANEELYNGYTASISCCLFAGDQMSFAHTGNTRINLMRYQKKADAVVVRQLTKDQTEGQRGVEEGRFTFEEYHIRPERLVLTGGLGMLTKPVIQTFTMKLKERDFILITTDGIHYAIRADAFLDILVLCETCDDAVDAMVMAAKELEYADNMTAALFWFAPDAPARTEE